MVSVSEVPDCYFKPGIFCTNYAFLGRWRILNSPIWIFGIGFYSLVIEPSQNVHDNFPKWLEQLMELGDFDG